VNITANACALNVNGPSVSATQHFDGTVSTAPPTPQIFRGDLVTLAADAASCVASDTFTFAWEFTQKPAGSTATLLGADTATPSFRADVAGGTYAVVVHVTDAFGKSTTPAALQLGVQPVPGAPAVTGLAAFVTAATSATVTVQGVANAAYSCSATNAAITSGSTGALSAAGTAALTLTAGLPGPLMVSCVQMGGIIASDAGSAGSQVVAAPVSPNIATVASATVGRSYTASIATQAGSTYSWTISLGSIVSPGGTAGVTSSDGRTNSIQFTSTSNGAANLFVTETNAAGTSGAAGQAQITFVAAAAAPAISALGTVTVGTTFVASISPRAGMSYAWSTSAGSLGTVTGCTKVAATCSAQFTAPTSATTFVVSVTESNSVGDSFATGTATIAAVGVDPAASTLTASGPVTADLTQLSNIVFVARNSTGAAIAGAAVTLNVSGTGNSLSATSGSTDPTGQFSATLASSVAETKSVSITASIGAETVTVGPVSVTFLPGPVAKFTFAGLPNSSTAGDNLPFTVRAADQFGNLDGNYRGTANFTSSDAQSAFTFAFHIFTADDNGTFTANTVTLKTGGVQTITATDATIASVKGSATVTVNAAAPANITLTGLPATVTAGDQNAVTVTARDQYGNVSKGPNAYLGTVHFTSTDANATLPADFTFQSGDNGTHTFATLVKLVTAGAPTVTASDGTFSSTQTVTVNSAAPASITLSGLPATVTAGDQNAVTITAKDQFGNLSKGPNAYLGTVHFTSTVAISTLPADFTFHSGDNGTHTFATLVKLITAGAQTVTASDGTLSSTQNVTVNAAAPASITLSGLPATVTAGDQNAVTVTAKDQFGNVSKGPNAYLGTVHFTSTDANATLPIDFTFHSGDDGTHAFATLVKLVTAGAQTVTASDGTFSSTQNVTVNAAAPASITLSGLPGTVTAGDQNAVTVTAKDQFGNVSKGPNAYLGTVHFTSTDANATLPADFTFHSGDDGTHTFATLVKLVTAGAQTVTASDGTFSSTQNVTVKPAAAESYSVVLAANPAATTVATNVTVTALDQFSNVATGYSGTVHFTSTDGAALLPADSTLVNGTKLFTGGVTFKTVGSQKVTASDGSINGTSVAVTVNAWFSTTNSALQVRRLAVDSTTAIAYAATNGDGVFISGDDGSSWSPASTPPADTNVEEIAVAPTSTTSVLYAATATGGVFTSTDDGATWAPANGSTTGTVLADPNTRSIVTNPGDATGLTAYVGTTTDVFVTVDGGSITWTSTGFPTNSDPINALAIGGGALYAGTAGGSVYAFNGTTWTNLTFPGGSGVDSLFFNSGKALAGTADGHIFTFDTTTTTWNGGVTAGTHPIFQIAFASATTGYAASAGGGVFKTIDGGGTTDWTAATTGITNSTVQGVAVDATTATTVFAGTDGDGFFKTLTAGQ
jgi:hypothetical protein